MLRSLTQLSLAATLLAGTATSMYAQTFVPPNAIEYTFGDPHVGPAVNTSCYSLSGSYAYFPDMDPVIPSGTADLYVAGWNSADIGGTHEVTVLLTAYGDPSNVLWKTSIPYTDVQDLEVGSIRNTTTNNTNIIVAYYKPGSGHMLDIYELSAWGAPYQLVDHKVLSQSPTYGRIRMDFHAVYDIAIAWVNTATLNKGVQAIVYTSNTWSGVSTLAGTAAKTGVDIAITRVTEPVNSSSIAYPLHFVYSGAGLVTESSVDINLLATSPGTVTPVVNDNNYVGAGLASRLVLDCADFSRSSTVINGSSWAYTYSDGMNAIVRHRNPAMGAAQTVAVTTGMLGNSPLDPSGGVYRVFSPAVNYGWGFPAGAPEQIMVTWYATDGIHAHGYMGLQMDVNGTTVTSTPDYLLLPNAFATPIPAGTFNSGIALSKIGPKSVGYFLYATYYDVDPGTGTYQLHHAFHQWGDVVFKPGGSTGLAAAAKAGTAKIDVYPNPFTDVLNATIVLQEAGIVHLQLHDLSGRQVWQYEGALGKGSHQLKTKNMKELAPGSYMLSTFFNGKKIETKTVVKK